jgi:hypothetical protein
MNDSNAKLDEKVIELDRRSQEAANRLRPIHWSRLDQMPKRERWSRACSMSERCRPS